MRSGDSNVAARGVLGQDNRPLHVYTQVLIPCGESEKLAMLVYISVDDCVYIRIHGLRHSVCYKENGDFCSRTQAVEGGGLQNL